MMYVTACLSPLRSGQVRIYNRIPEAFRMRVVIGLTGEYNQSEGVFIRSGQVRIYNRIPEAFRMRVVIGVNRGV